MVKMEKGSPKNNIILGSIFMIVAVANNYIMFEGLCAFLIVLGIFESKKYDNNKLLLSITILILAISLILTYFQMSAPSYSGNVFFNYLVAVLFVLIVILFAYDLTHDYKLSKISKMENTSQKMKDIIAILLLVMGAIVGLMIGIYIYKI